MDTPDSTADIHEDHDATVFPEPKVHDPDPVDIADAAPEFETIS